MTIKPTPFTLHIPDAAIADLRERLGRTRYPDQAPGEAWAYGTEVDYLRDLTEYWRTAFDWRAEEAALNAFPQFRAALDDVDLHYLHVPGVGPDPMPLLLLHGWPGSVFEFLDIIPRLTDPARFGGTARDAFTVVAPSLPGYGLSFQPGMKRFGVPEMGDCLAALMTDVLGYKKFGAQGGDWGAAVTSRLGYSYADRMIGIHINLMMVAGRDPAEFPNPTLEEQDYLAELKRWMHEETGYQRIQGTKPQTLAFALTDSPAGLAAWDRGEIPFLVRLQWRDRECDCARPHARRHFTLLVHRRDRLVVLALLRPSARFDAARRRHDLRADRLRAIPARNAETAAPRRRARVHRHPALERDAEGRTFRSVGAAGTARRRGAGVLPGIALTGFAREPGR
jgi:pimeloyl-ACP methyl ester carboxylesterase